MKDITIKNVRSVKILHREGQRDSIVISLECSAFPETPIGGSEAIISTEEGFGEKFCEKLGIDIGNY